MDNNNNVPEPQELLEGDDDDDDRKIAATTTTTATIKSSSNKKTDGRMVKLISKDDRMFELPLKAAIQSILVRDSCQIDDEDDDEDEDDEEERNGCGDTTTTTATTSSTTTANEVPIPRVAGNTLARVVEFLRHHEKEPMNEIPLPLGGSTFDEVITQVWYREFMDPITNGVDKDVLFELLAAANYMDIKPLLDLACLKVTFQMKGLSAEEIRVMLNLPRMTEEEEQLARQEHPWIFEEN